MLISHFLHNIYVFALSQQIWDKVLNFKETTHFDTFMNFLAILVKIILMILLF